MQEVAAPANGKWQRPRGWRLGKELAAWLPRAGSWVPGPSQGESRHLGSQRTSQTPDLPDALGNHEASACKVPVRRTRTVVWYQACVQKLFCIPHLRNISFTHDTSFLNSPSCVICLLFFFHLLLSIELIFSLTTHYNPKILLLSDNRWLRNNYFEWEV